MRKALLIEDDPDVRQIYRLLLQHAGWAVVDAVTAEQGLTLMTGHRPDLVILDLGFGKGLGGMEIIETLRASHDAPIVVVSGDDTVEDEVRRRGAAAYLLKPFDPFEELLPIIEQVTASPDPPA